MKKLIAAVTTGLIAIALVVVGAAAPASAHTASITGTNVCTTATGAAVVTWSVHNDWTTSLTISATSKPAVVALNTEIDAGATKTFTEDIPAPAAGVTAALTLSFHWSDYDENNVSGSTKVSNTCRAPDASAAIVNNAATCSSAQTVGEGAITKASWTTDVTTSPYDLVATAAAGYSFTAASAGGGTLSHDNTVDTFTGTLADKLTSGCAPPPVCIPDSAVTYTYSHNDANMGVITVNDVDNSTGVLCHPFWVTATSWTFINTTGWPQHVDVVDQLGKISTPGAYDYAAQVTCGQGDIYASTDSSAPSLNPANYPVDTGYLLNPSSPFLEHFLSQMGFTQTGSSGDTWIVDNANCWQPPTPTSSVGSCRAPNGNSLDLPAVPGGEWTITSSGSDHTYGNNSAVSITDANLPDGYVTYTITLADDNPNDIFKVSPYSGTWTPVDVGTLGCTPESGTPTSSVATCQAPDGNSLDLPAVPGGEWTVTSSGSNQTYGDNTEVSFTGSTLPDGYVTYTITLADDNSSDGYTVTPYSGTWTPVDASTLGCTPESGTPTSSVATCQAPDGNSLDLPAVPGGTWTISWATDSYTILGDDTGASITDATLADGYVTYTITLADDNPSDGYTVTPYSGTWTPVDASTLGCTPESGTPTSSVATCQGPDGNSLDLPAVPGGSWTVSWSTGDTAYGDDTAASIDGSSLPNGYVTYTITLADDNPSDSYTVTPYSGTWTPVDATTLNCTLQYTSGDVCSYVGGVSLTDVFITLDNSDSSIPATFSVDGTSYPLAGGDTTVAEVDNVAPGTVIDVYLTGSPNVFATVTATVPDQFGCTPVTAGDPSATPATCDAATNTLGGDSSLTVDLVTGLSYTITGPAGWATVTGLTGSTGKTYTNVPAGDYAITVSALPGYVLNTASMTDWTFDLDGNGHFPLTLAATFCDFGVSVTHASCNPPIGTEGGKFSTAVEVFGTITVDLNSNVIYTAVETTSPFTVTTLTDPTTTMPDGMYNVNVTLSPAGVTAGYVLDGPVAFGPFDLSTFCPPTGASWNAGATGTNAVCTDGSTTEGTITLEHDADQTGDVTYTVTDDATSAVVYHGTNSTAGPTLVTVGAGHYTVTATPTNPLDGLSPNPANTASDTDNFQTFPIDVTLTSSDCDGSLAFTGGTIAWLGFVLAGGMLFLGFALLYMRRRGNRTAE